MATKLYRSQIDMTGGSAAAERVAEYEGVVPYL